MEVGLQQTGPQIDCVIEQSKNTKVFNLEMWYETKKNKLIFTFEKP